MVDQTVGRINMEYGSLEHQPIHYLYHSINFTELCALYTLGTPLPWNSGKPTCLNLAYR